MPLKFKVSKHKGFDNFTDAVRQLADLTGNDMKSVIDGEVSAILTETAAKTVMATPNKIISDHNAQQWGTFDINGKRERLNLRWKLPDAKAQIVQTKRRASLQRKLKKAGIAARHWFEQGKILGLDVKAHPRVKYAEADFPISVRAYRKGEGDTYSVSGSNFSRLSIDYAQGTKALKSAVSKRLRFFRKAMQNWAEGHVKRVARRYPHLLKVT